MGTKDKKPCIAYAGNQNIGHRCLNWLIEQGENVVAVIGVPHNVSEQQYYASVAELARENSIPTIVPERVNSEASVSWLRAQRPDLLLSISYREMFKPPILEIPRLGGVNFHGAMLPQYRGCAPINWAILNGETETGVTFHYMDSKPDHGDIIAQERVPIGPDDTAQEVWERATEVGFTLFTQIYYSLLDGTAPRKSQVGLASSYFGRRKPEDGAIDWQTNSRGVHNLVRAVTRPFPGAFTTFDGERAYIWKTSVPSGGGDALRPGEIASRKGEMIVGTGDGRIQVHDLSFMGSDSTGRYFCRVHDAEGKRFV